MNLDLVTLLIVSQVVCCACGLLFLVEAFRERTASGWWFACSFLFALMAPAFYIPAAFNSDWSWGFPVGNGVATIAVALAWVGARSFNGRSTTLWTALVGPTAMVLSVLLFENDVDAWSGAVPFMLTFSVYSFLAAREFWRGPISGQRLGNAVILAATCACVGCFYLLRGLTLHLLHAEHPFFFIVLGSEVAGIVVMLAVLVSSFTLVALSKEKGDIVIKHAATHDGLTDLLNRREFTRRAQDMVDRLSSARQPITMLLLDLDHFKRINDTYGHSVGDEVLIAFARIAKNCLRPCDVIGRYGGEEFAILLPGAVPEQAIEVAERIRTTFSCSPEALVVKVKPTISIGVAINQGSDSDLGKLVSMADHALYKSKAAGRNRVTSADMTGEPLRLAS
jgi:diguanylate cyclase (GGDEF)-like protein